MVTKKLIFEFYENDFKIIGLELLTEDELGLVLSEIKRRKNFLAYEEEQADLV